MNQLSALPASGASQEQISQGQALMTTLSALCQEVGVTVNAG
jgi:hypothetical protein